MRELLALCLTAGIVFSLLAFAQPSGAVLTTVSGPDQVERPDEITLTAAVEIREDERIPVEGIDLVIATAGGEEVTVTLAPNGTVREIDPPNGVVGQGEIRVARLRNTIDVTPLPSDANYGYGYRAAEDERTDESESFGYGYGYGDGDPAFAFRIELDSRAFRHGAYDLRVDVDSGDTTFSSDVTSVEVRLPAGNQLGGRPAERGAGWDRGDSS